MSHPERGKLYVHPDDGVIEITGGYFLDPVNGRVSNHFYWRVLATGEEHNGYGGDWPVLPEHIAPYPFREFRALLTARGFVRFVKLRPERKSGRWVCDECHEPVTPSKQIKHAREHR